MATRIEIELVCDLCESTDLVSTHRLSIDGHTVDSEVCDKCWGKILTTLVPISNAGRQPQPVKVTRKKDVYPFPGSTWKFTAHALKRMGERHISPVDAARAADNPDITNSGLDNESEVRSRGNIKVVVKPASFTIITVSKRDETVDEVA